MAAASRTRSSKIFEVRRMPLASLPLTVFIFVLFLLMVAVLC
jgi:hypothetical protein